MKSITKKSDALSSTKEILRAKSKDIFSRIGKAEIKLIANTSSARLMATETYLRYSLKKGAKNEARSGKATK
jgi:hypothetical protein